MMITGPSWWMVYHNGGALGRLADHVNEAITCTGLALCGIAPFLADVSARQKFALFGLGAVIAGIISFLSGFLVLLIYGV